MGENAAASANGQSFHRYSLLHPRRRNRHFAEKTRFDALETQFQNAHAWGLATSSVLSHGVYNTLPVIR